MALLFGQVEACFVKRWRAGQVILFCIQRHREQAMSQIFRSRNEVHGSYGCMKANTGSRSRQVSCSQIKS